MSHMDWNFTLTRKRWEEAIARRGVVWNYPGRGNRKRGRGSLLLRLVMPQHSYHK